MQKSSRDEEGGEREVLLGGSSSSGAANYAGAEMSSSEAGELRQEQMRAVKLATLVSETASMLIDVNSTKMLDKLQAEAIEKREQDYKEKVEKLVVEGGGGGSGGGTLSGANAMKAEGIWNRIFQGVEARRLKLQSGSGNDDRSGNGDRAGEGAEYSMSHMDANVFLADF